MVTVSQFEVKDKLSDSNEQIENMKDKSECRGKILGTNFVKA